MERTPTVMVVEDETLIAIHLGEELEKNGCDVVDIVSSGEEAIASNEKRDVDLILMDIRLPGSLDGIETWRRIKKSSKAKVIFMTGYAEKEYVNRAMELNPVGYFNKPLRFSNLLKLIKSTFRNGRPSS